MNEKSYFGGSCQATHQHQPNIDNINYPICHNACSVNPNSESFIYGGNKVKDRVGSLTRES